jgi:histidyl-tRNA synthetase
MKPSIPQGTRDFGPEEVRKRNYIFDTIKEIFIRYGYQPIETPAMEDLSTLTGKYGEEGDKLLFKILNNGDFLAQADEEILRMRDSNRLTPHISKRGLRYDLTVPFARFVVMNQSQIAFPFKRYQIQPVWRADRPQKGRYREFFQCDVDVVGSDSLVYEAELTQIYDEAFHRLGLDVVIKINNRKILAGIAETAGIGDKLVPMTTAIDKLDKIGMEGVQAEMLRRGIPEEAVATIKNFLMIKSLDQLQGLFPNSETGQKGIAEMETFFQYFDPGTAKNEVKFDITLARGLDYYTGCIFEVQAKGVEMGSIGGGGRYDDLTGVFGLEGVSGVGVSFGAERIYDIMESLRLFPEKDAAALKAIFIAFDAPTHHYAFQCLGKVRAAGVNAEIYPDPVKLKKQMKYADARKTAYVILIGSREMETGELTLKDMTTGAQQNLPLEKIIEILRNA